MDDRKLVAMAQARLQNQRTVGRSENALPLQIVAAFVTDLPLRAFKHCGGFKGKLYEFVTTCRDLALVPVARLGSLREVLLAATRFLELSQFLPQTQTCE